MSPIERISPEEAFEQVSTGEALLVCAYEDEEKCRQALDQALHSRRSRTSSAVAVPRDRKIVFYCA